MIDHWVSSLEQQGCAFFTVERGDLEEDHYTIARVIQDYDPPLSEPKCIPLQV
jgi:hypothetical protein